MTNDQTTQASLISVDHVADFGRRYPGETLILYTRVVSQGALPGYTLRVRVPRALEIEDYVAPPAYGSTQPYIEVDESVRYILWEFDTPLAPGESHEYQTITRVLPLTEDAVASSEARVKAQVGDDSPVWARESASVLLHAKARYVQHLPALYERDDFMNRLLMFFESFWIPIEQKVDLIYNYFDPQLAPPQMLHWMASWINLALEEHWPEARQRQLLASAVHLYRKRGTRPGLKKILEIYTGCQPQIVEHRAHNLRLGPDAYLGPGVALGRGNEPYTFTVNLRLPPATAEEGAERERLEAERRRRIETIIRAEKPAHTAYTLHIEIDPAAEPDTLLRSD